MRKTRKSKRRQPLKIIRLLCEGKETEPDYFRGVFNQNSANRRKYNFKAMQPKKYQPPLEIVKMCVQELEDHLNLDMKRKDIFIWAVFDRDTHPKMAEAFQLAKKEGIDIVFSSISIEYWILLHYERKLQFFKDSEAIERYIRKNHDPTYNKTNVFKRLKDKVSTAVEHGEWVIEQTKEALAEGKQIYELNPYTDAHKLVKFLQED